MAAYTEQTTTHIGEINLIAAVITRALVDASGNTVIGGDRYEIEQRNARIWLNSNVIAPYSFIWCCEALNIAPHKIRAYYKSLKYQINSDFLEKK